MDTLCVKLDKVGAQVKTISSCRITIQNANQRLDEIKDRVKLDSSTTKIRNAIITYCNLLKNEEDTLAKLEEQLEAICSLYSKTEEEILGFSTDVKKSEVDKPEETENTPESEDYESLDEKIAKITGLSEKEIEIIKFILGFIPGVNVITDIYQLVDDIRKAYSDDGKITGKEWLALIADLAFLGLDLFALDGILKAAKTAKLAKTNAKVARETAEAAAKTAEKKAAEAATRTAGKTPTTTAAQKTVKAAKTAEKNATKAAKKAQEAEQAAKDAAQQLSKDITTGIVENIEDEYTPTVSNGGMPNAAKRDARDSLLPQPD